MKDFKQSPEAIAEQRIEEARRGGARNLNFYGLGLTQLPTSIGQLPQLQELYIPYHQFTALPEELGQLIQLQILNIAENQLTALPENIGQLTQLKILDVAQNQLTALPKELGQLTQLQILDISDNQLTTLPGSLGQLTQLKWIFLHGNPRLKLPPEVLGPTPVKIRSNSGCQFIVDKKPAAPASILEYYFCNCTNNSSNEIETTLLERGDVTQASTVQRLVHDPVRVVFSYSRKDEKLRDQLESISNCYNVKALLASGMTARSRLVRSGKESSTTTSNVQTLSCC